MSAATQVSLAEYLSTEYEPDCEYIDGVLEDRNVGKRKHSQLQGLLTSWLLSQPGSQGHDVLVEQRVQISGSRVRIPDICLVAAGDEDEVIQHPPTLWIEILSPDDRWSRIQRKLIDVLHFGVPVIWIIDPYEREAWMTTSEHGTVKVEDGRLRCEALGLELELEQVLPRSIS
jgi:Uma2 family endonuclease